MPEKKDSYQPPAGAGNGGQELANQQLFQLLRAMVTEIQRQGSGATTQALSAEEQTAIDFGEAAFDGLESRLALKPTALTVTRIDPGQGPKEGGLEVTITGTNFIPGAAVTFGGIPATKVTVESSERIIATTPKGGAAGQVLVAVSTFGGVGFTSFQYN